MPDTSSKRIWLLLGALLVASGALLFQLRSAPQISLPLYDFVEYWAAGKLAAERRNPYDQNAIAALETQAGREEPPVMMWNPPWTLTFVMPFGLLDVHLAHFLWLALALLMLLLSADTMWRIYGHQLATRWIAWILVLAFVPSLNAMTVGQISPWLLLGATGFLFFARREQWMLAGMATVLLAIKPHLSYLFWLALLLWCIQERKWKLILGGLIFGAICILIPMWRYPHVFTAYLDALANRPPSQYESPTLGTILRLIFDKDNFSLQYLSMIPGVIWLIPYWLRHRHNWKWSERLPMLLLVSMLTAAYGAWPFDVLILLPAIIQIAARLDGRGTQSQRITGVGIYLLINIAAGVMLFLDPGYFAFIWLTPSLLLTYVIFQHLLNREETPAHA